MGEEAARLHWTDDYERLRERARAELAADDAKSSAAGSVRVISSRQRPQPDLSAVEHTEQGERRRFARAHQAAPRRPAARATPRAYGSRTGSAPPRTLEAAGPRRIEREPSARRTVVVTGHPTPARRRSPVAARVAAEPDRTALWAVLLGIFLALVAVATAHASPVPVGHASPPAAHSAPLR